MVDIPPYLKLSDQENYNEELNQNLFQGIGPNGFTIPNLTTAQIASIESTSPLGTIWFNTDIAKLQVLTAVATIETITSA